MKAWFADTYFFLALLSDRDEDHEKAIAIVRNLKRPIVTTAWVLTEVGDALASPTTRGGFGNLLGLLRANPRVTILPPDRLLFDDGIALYLNRPDKEWSLPDCISFTAMTGEGLHEALTGDHHFEQAGFKTLL